jgi:aspartyl-tRNA(Asn)/glutamyl-tRNA(Gln) amidotransferase subunit C
MAEVNEELTRKVADLAHLSLTEEEVRTFTSQLGEILSYVSQLPETQVEPLTHPLGLEATPMRNDEVRPMPGQSCDDMLAPAPDVLERGFKVPPIL